MREIFGKWLREDADHSWKKLIECLKRCDLNSIASDIEDSLGMSTQSTEGLVLSLAVDIYIYIYSMWFHIL